MAQEKTTEIVHAVTAEDLKVQPAQKRYWQGFAQYVRVLMQNWRQGTVAVKDRSQVSRTTAKPWRQKGTGRARAGTPRSPIWRGGGVTFGPQSRDRKLALPRQVRRKVLFNVFADMLKDKRILSLDWKPGVKPKTADAEKALKQAGLQNKKVVLFVPMNDYAVHAAFANIPYVRLLLFDQPNAYDLTNGAHWVFLKRDHSLFEAMVRLWT